MTEREGLEVLALFASAYPKEPMTDAQVSLYLTMLAPYEFADVQRIAVMHIQRSPFFPRISDLLLPLTKSPDSDQAWAEVLSKIRAEGYYRTPVWSDEAIADAVKAMGWQELCMSENLEADRAHFARFYERAQARKQERVMWNRALESTMVRKMISTIGRLPQDGESHAK